MGESLSPGYPGRKWQSQDPWLQVWALNPEAKEVKILTHPHPHSSDGLVLECLDLTPALCCLQHNDYAHTPTLKYYFPKWSHGVLNIPHFRSVLCYFHS